MIRALVALLAMAAPAIAHEWYTGTVDPVHGVSCCGDIDCAPLDASLVRRDDNGYRIVLDEEQTRSINKHSRSPLDAPIPLERVKESGDGQYHLCIDSSHRAPPRYGVRCFFAPPQS